MGVLLTLLSCKRSYVADAALLRDFRKAYVCVSQKINDDFPQSIKDAYTNVLMLIPFMHLQSGNNERFDIRAHYYFW